MKSSVQYWDKTFAKFGFRRVKAGERGSRTNTIPKRKRRRKTYFDGSYQYENLEPRQMLAATPDLTFDLNGWQFGVAQDASYNSVAGTIDADDTGNSNVYYSAIGDAWPFQVEPWTGNISVYASEAVTAGETYTFDVMANNGLVTDTSTVTVAVGAEANADPAFNSSQYTFDLDFNATAGTVVGSVTANDAENDSVQYWTDWSWPIGIDPDTGTLTAYYTDHLQDGDVVEFDAWVADATGSHKVPVTINVKDTSGGGPPGGGGGGPQFMQLGGGGDPIISGDDNVNEADVYTINLDKNGTAVDQWMIDWGDDSTPETYTSLTTQATHVYADGDEAYTIEVTAYITESGTEGLEGKTPGFWKQPHHTSYWLDTPYRPTDNYESTFGVDLVAEPPRMIDAVKAKRKDAGNDGTLAALWRHSTAALLNAAHPSINYNYTVSQVIAMVQAAYTSGDYETNKDLFEIQNEKGGDANNGGSSSTRTVTFNPVINVDNVPPTLEIDGVTTINEGDTFNLSLSSVDPGDDTITHWDIDWGDGNSETVSGNPTSVPHVFTNGTNTYTITSTATDEDGTFYSNEHTVVVQDVLPTVVISGATNVDEGSTYTLNLSYSDPGDDPVTQWYIDWGDSVANNEYVPGDQTTAVHTYADGDASHTIWAIATSQEGNFSANSLTVNVDNVAPQVAISGPDTAAQLENFVLNLSANNDPGDDTITHWIINWGDGSADEQVNGNPSATTHQFSQSGVFTITASVYDEDGNYAATPIVVTVNASVNNIHLVENSDFVVEHAFQFTVPASLSPLAVQLSFFDLTFDATDVARINDAFEVALVIDDASDPDNNETLGPMTVQGRDAAFNLTESEIALTSGTTVYDAQNGLVTINIEHLAVGTTARLIARLVNNDSDETTTVKLKEDLQFVQWAGGALSTTVPPGYSPQAVGREIDFRHLSDVTPSIGIDYAQTSFNKNDGVLFANLSLINIRNNRLRGPFVAVLKNIRGNDAAVDVVNNVQVHGFDGFTPDGNHYFDLTHLLPEDQRLIPDAVVDGFELKFANPDNVQFDFDLEFVAYVNQGPDFVSTPVKEVKPGNTYTYDSDADDPEDDDLAYWLVEGPDGMTIDENSGIVTWSNTTGQTGEHTVEIGVNDPDSEADRQIFTISVRTPTVNRPPRFTSTPIYEAFVNTPYTYNSTAFDADGDSPLTYSVVSGPNGFAITDANSGTFDWTPTAADVGNTIAVEISVTDGNVNSSDTQVYNIYVKPEPGNLPPVITSTPKINFELAGDSNPATANVSPNELILLLGPGQTTTEYVSINLNVAPMVDVFILMDDSGSFADQLPGLASIFQTNVINSLTTSLPSVDFGFGVGRFEDYSSHAFELATGRPFILNQPILSTGFQDFDDIIGDALARVAPGMGGLWGPEALIEGVFQVATGQGLDHDNDGNVDGSGYAGSIATQTTPGTTGDVPSFVPGGHQNLTPYDPNDPNYVTVPFGPGTLGGAGFRQGAIPIILVATDFGTFHRDPNANGPNSRTDIVGLDGVVVDFDEIDFSGDVFVPHDRAATAQGTVDALLDLGAFVIGLGDPEDAIDSGQGGFGSGIGSEWCYDSGEVNGSDFCFEVPVNPRPLLEGLATATGSTNQTTQTFSNGTTDDIAPGDPFYFEIDSTQATSIASGITSAVDSFLAYQDFPIELRVTDPNVTFTNVSGAQSYEFGNSNFGNLQFEVDFGGDGQAHNFDLQFVREGTNQILGTMPVMINYGYYYDVNAVDPDGDVLTYELVGETHGATISSTTGELHWRPDDSSTSVDYDFTVKVTDGRGGEDTQSWTVTVDPVDANNTNPSIDMVQDQAANTPNLTVTGLQHREIGISITASDVDGDNLYYWLLDLNSGGSAAIPTGMTIDNHTGDISWTPGAGDIGPYTVTVRVTDGRTGFDDVEFTVDVKNELQNRRPIITSNPLTSAVANQRYTYQIDAIDPDGDALSYGLAFGPQTMVVDPDTGVAAWNPTDDDAGSVMIGVKAIDSFGASTVQHFELTVSLKNEAPEFVTYPTTLPARLSVNWKYFARAIDPNGDTPVYRLDSDSLNRGMTIDSATGEVNWTSASTGNYRVTITALDERGGEATQSFVLPVRTNHAPAITSTPTTSHDVDNVYSYPLTFSDFEGDDVRLSLDVASLSRGMRLVREIDESWTLKWQPEYVGVYPVSITATDTANAYSIQTYDLTVIDPGTTNQSPRILSDAPGPAVKDRLYTYDALGFDPDGDSINWSIDPATVVGDMAIDSNGRFTWTPAVDGNFNITIIADDLVSASVSQTFTLVVLENAPPVITSLPVTSVNFGTTYAYSVLATDPNPGHTATLVYSLDLAPAGMNIDSVTGVIDWASAPVSTETIIVRVTDQDGEYALQEFDLRVLGTNAAPVVDDLFPDRWQVGVPMLQQVYATDADGDSLTFSLDAAAPVGMTISSDGIIEWTPSGDDLANTPKNFTVTVSDGTLTGSQAFTVNIVSQMTNDAPTITSIAISNVVIGTDYSYQVTANDPEGDPLRYRLIDGPDGMSVDARTGIITWSPTIDDLGQNRVAVQAHDPFGASDTQIFDLDATYNHVPIIESDPREWSWIGDDYKYQVIATDADGDTLNYEIIPTITTATGPYSINPNGLLSWVPGAASPIPTPFVFAIRVTDSLGATDEQVFSVVVHTDEPNIDPVITSEPVRWADITQPYSYQIVATDENVGDTLTYSLVEPVTPLTGMNLDSNGLFTWTPNSDSSVNVGDMIDIGFRVDDGAGAAVFQWYTLRILAANQPPVIAPIDDLTLTVGHNLAIDVDATDQDNYDLRYDLDAVSISNGLTIDQLGRIRWTSDQQAVTGGPYTVTVTVTDWRGGSASEPFTVTVLADTVDPTVAISFDRDNAFVGDEIGVFVYAYDDVGVESKTLRLVEADNGGVITALDIYLRLDDQGRARLTLTDQMIGELKFEAIATDVNGNSSAPVQDNFTVYDPSDENPPTVHIASPFADLTIEEPIDIVGTAMDDITTGFTWALVAVSLGTGTVHQLASGTDQRDNVVLAEFDPTLLTNGRYQIQLSATDSGGWTRTSSVTVTVAGNLKLGDMKVGFVDLEIPVRGMSIAITRSYDSKNAETQGDFGNGWQLDIDATKLEVKHADGTRNGSYGYAAFRDGTRVVVTLPDGTQEGFTFYGQAVGFGSTYLPRFQADSGVRTQLIVNEVYLFKLGDEYIDAENAHEYNPADPIFGNSYELRQRNGTKIVMNATDGKISTIEDREGNLLTFTGMGIIHSAGRSALFDRDYRGRISALIDPNGNKITYDYSTDGDLVAVTDRNDNTTTFGYNDSNREHFLTDITDALGRQPVVTTYYPTEANNFNSGRIQSITDADGKSIDYSWELAGNSWESGVQVPIKTTLEHMYNGVDGLTKYDIKTVTELSRGNETYVAVSQVDDITGALESDVAITKRTFNGDDRLLSEITVVGLDDTTSAETNDLTTQYVYHEETGDLIRTIDVRGNSTWTTYNDIGQPVLSSDMLGNKTWNQFGSITGRLLRTWSPTFEAGFTYTSEGDLWKISDADGVLLSETINNEWGDVRRTTDANGRYTYFNYDDDTGELQETYYDQVIDHDDDPATPDKTYRFKDITTRDLEGEITGTTRYLIDVTDPDPNNHTQTQISVTDSDYKNDIGQDTQTIDNYGLETEYTYDLRGQTIETRSQSLDSDGNTVWTATRTVYDAKGRAIVTTGSFEVDASGNQITPDSEITGTRTTYDALDRAVKSEHIRDFHISIDKTVPEQFTSSLAGTVTEISSSSTTYDNAGRVTESIDSYGFKTSYVYNKYGETIETRSEAVDEAGNTVELVSRTVYDEFGRSQLSTDSFIIDHLGVTQSDPIYGTQTIYDELGRAHKTVRVKGIMVDIVNGESVISNHGSIISTTQTIYNAKGQVQSSIDSFGNQTDYTEVKDGSGKVLEKHTTGPKVQVNGQLVRHRSKTIFDSQGRTASEISGFVVDDHGAEDGTNANQTDFTYDHFGNVVRTTFDDGSFVMNHFDIEGQRLAESHQFGAVTVTGHKSVWSDTDNSFVVIDTLNNDALVSTIPTRLFGYDTVGRLVSVELPAVANPDNGGTAERPKYEYGYDADGNQTLIRDPLGHETRFTYNEQGQQATRTLPIGFGPDGVQGTADDTSLPEGNFNELFENDDRGRQTLHTSFEGVVTENVYNAITGRMSQKRFFTDAASYNGGTADETWAFTYDARGRVLTAVVTDALAVVLRTETTSYNEQGIVDTVSNEEGAIHYEYDSFGRQTSVSFSGSNFTPANSTDYDNVTQYTYDELGRLKTVSAVERNDTLVDIDSGTSGNQADVTTYEYDANGNMASTEYSNGIIHGYQYDDMNRLDLLQHFIDNNADGVYDAGDELLANFDYTLGDDSRRTSVNETFYDEAGAVRETNTFNWTYDEMGRLIGETLDSSDNSLDYVDSFVYDLTGNRKSTTRDWGDAAIDDYTTNYTYDANDRLDSETKDYVGATPDVTTSYDYDHTQQTHKTVEANGLTTNKQEFAYDVKGRMSQVKAWKYDGSGTLTEYTETSYEYDSAGNRVSTEHGVSSDGDEIIDSTTRTEYLTDSRNHTGYSQVLQDTEFDGNGVEIKKTVYTIGHDQISQTIFDSANPTGVTHYFGYDGHGSVRVLYDVLGAVVNDLANSTLQIFHYDAYGYLINMPVGVSPITSYLYSGESFDARIGQQYLRARWYDSTNGRFNRLDPFSGNSSDPQSLHKYAYVHGDPIQGTDPSGRFISIAVAISARLGFTVGSLAALSAIFADLSLIATGTLLAWLRFSVTERNGQLQFPKQVYDEYVQANENYVKIENAQLTADEMFAELAEFNPRNFIGSPTVPQKNGNQVTWSLLGITQQWGQADFDVQIDQLDTHSRFISVITLGGHPLSGFRYWEVRADDGNSRDYTIVTGAVEHNTTAADWFKATIGGPVIDWPPYDNGTQAVLRTWDALLTNLASISQGDVNQSESKIEGYWDEDLIPSIKQKVNWRYRN